MNLKKSEIVDHKVAIFSVTEIIYQFIKDETY
jgi:hypothetical protein